MMVAIALTLAQINRYNERNKVKMKTNRFQNETQASDIRDTLILELIKLDILYTITTSSPEEYIYNSIRLSWDDTLTDENVDYVIDCIKKNVKKVRGYV